MYAEVIAQVPGFVVGLFAGLAAAVAIRRWL